MARSDVDPCTVLVLGGGGMLGQTCVRYLTSLPGFSVDSTQRRDRGAPLFVDVGEDIETPRTVLRRRRYDFVINCIGVLGVNLSSQDPCTIRAAIRVNALFPQELAADAASAGARVLHVSSDAVFSGVADAPCDEYTRPGPSDTYGASKLLGESALPNVLNVRCSIIGRDALGRRGLLEWFLGLPPGAPASGFVDYRWTPVTTRQLAQLFASMMEPRTFDALRGVSSVYHFAPNSPLSKFDLLHMVNRLAGDRVRLTPAQNPTGPTTRVLATRFDVFRHLYPAPREWSDILTEALHVGGEP